MEPRPPHGRVDVRHADRSAPGEGLEARAGIVGVLHVVDRPDQVVAHRNGDVGVTQ
jgi:hypothetical protein